MPSIITTLDVYGLNVRWSFTDLCQNDCVIPIKETIVTNVCGDGDCPFHGMLFFTCHDDFTHDLKTPRAQILRKMTCNYMRNNPEDKHGHAANSVDHSEETTFRQECIQNFRESDAGRELSEKKVPVYINSLQIAHLNEFEKYLAIMSQTSEYPSLVEVCAASMKISKCSNLWRVTDTQTLITAYAFFFTEHIFMLFSQTKVISDVG